VPYLFSILSSDTFLTLIAAYQVYALKDGTPTETPAAALMRWWDAYPTVKSSPPSITPEEVAALMLDPTSAADFVIIDVRRNDHAVRSQCIEY
jgi:arsenite methyltransferase